MNLNRIKEATKLTIEMGYSVSMSYKSAINEWYGEYRLFSLDPMYGKPKRYIIEPGWREFTDIDEAVNYYLDKTYTATNIGLLQKRLTKKGLINDDTDLENPSKEIKDLFKQEAELLIKELQEV